MACLMHANLNYKWDLVYLPWLNIDSCLSWKQFFYIIFLMISQCFPTFCHLSSYLHAVRQIALWFLLFVSDWISWLCSSVRFRGCFTAGLDHFFLFSICLLCDFKCQSVFYHFLSHRGRKRKGNTLTELLLESKSCCYIFARTWINPHLCWKW